MTVSIIFCVIFGVLLFLSLLLNSILYFYSRRIFYKIYVASEEVSKVLTMIDSYENHLKAVYEMPSFYGDETLLNLLNHTKELSEFIKMYEDVYSFTQPDLLDQLDIPDEETEEENGS